MKVLNVLFIDKEGGFGGSSRSLFYLVKYLDKERVKPTVIVGEKGPILEKYHSFVVSAYVCYQLPVFKAVQRKNIFMILKLLFDLKKYIRSFIFIRNIALKHNIDVIHINLESLFLIGLLCRLILRKSMVFHIRTQFPNNLVAKAQSYIISILADYIVFISENEYEDVKRLCRRMRRTPYSIIYNSSEDFHELNKTSKKSFCRGKFSIVCLRNISYVKGTDLLADIAAVLKGSGKNDICFVVCGSKRPYTERAFQKPFIDCVKEKIHELDVKEYFEFIGFQDDPGSVLFACDMLIRVCRNNNPWGRDIIEALSYGKPVIATGSYDKFVEDGKNGYLFPRFDAEGIAEKICYLADNPDVVRKMGKANIEKAGRLFNGRKNAGRITAIYESMMSGSHGKVP